MQFKTHLPVVTIGPGDHYTTKKQEVIKTLLGSCVAVCLFDPHNKVLGMNHFLLATDKLNRSHLFDSRAGYYGVHAMELLINGLLKAGAKKQFIRSKIFGGANVLKHVHGHQLNFYDVGRFNITFVQEFLNREKIPIQSEDVGGNYGRVIYFDPTDYSVYRSLIDHQHEQRLQAQEEVYFLRAEKEINKETTTIQIWNE